MTTSQEGSGELAAGPVVLAVAAHPDDVEFMMAGTMLRLGTIGARLHMWNLANGCCGTAHLSRGEITRIRWEEAQSSARIAGARLYPPLVDDGFILYERTLLTQAAGMVRKIQPDILLLPSPDDYMEDHQNTSRLLTTAAFVRGMVNFPCRPPSPPWDGETALYHALPHGLRDGLRRRVHPELYVDITPVLETKRRMLSCHRSQGEWLDASQGMGSHLTEMERMSKEVGKMSGGFEYAEGWRRHSHLGFSRVERDPLSELLGEACRVNPEYEFALNAAGVVSDE